ncbi:MAG: V-type ATPase subunit [Gemmatimonadota bacterium]
MRPGWEALAARARGLTSHLVDDQRLLRVERASDFAGVVQELRETAYAPLLPPPRDLGPSQVERVLTRSLSARMDTLARWAGPGGGRLAPLFLEQDARNVRSVLRGIVGALGPEQRLAGAVATPWLDRRALQHLARSRTAGSVAASLTTWGHPLGPALLEEAGEAHVDLFRLEAALDRGWALAASEAARRAGGQMRRFVAESLDVRNTLAALVLAGARREGESVDLFVEGGEILGREDFERAAAAGDRMDAVEIVEGATAGSPLAEALAERPFTAAVVSARILRARIARLQREGRTDPISALPVLLFVLRLRNENIRLRHALWAAAAAGGVRR